MYKGLTCGRLVFISNRSGAGKPFQTAPGHQLCILLGWYVLGYRYIPRKDACFWPLHTTSAQQRFTMISSCHEAATRTIAPRNFQKIHLLCKHSLSLPQYIMREKEDGNERRSLKIKFSVFAPSFVGFFIAYRARVENQFYRIAGVRILKGDDADQQNIPREIDQSQAFWSMGAKPSKFFWLPFWEPRRRSNQSAIRILIT